jgi:FkbM family methyltransferase
MMKKAIKQFLHKNDWYYPLKYSRLFSLYQLLFKPAVIQQQREEIAFYQSFLPACELIFDIGANDGHKTAAFLHIAKKVISCEPDKENFKLLQTRFRNKKEKVILENKALSDKEGTAFLHIHHPGSAFNTLSTKWTKVLEADNKTRWDESVRFSEQQAIETTTLDRLINQYGVPGFIKIDVEGFEETVLAGLSHRIPCLSFETLLPDYTNELQHCLSIIQSLDRTAVYNISLHEKLVLPVFVSRNLLEEWLKQNNNAPSFEIIVKMSA